MAYAILHHFPGATSSSTTQRSRSFIRAPTASPTGRSSMLPVPFPAGGTSSPSTNRRRAGNDSATRSCCRHSRPASRAGSRRHLKRRHTSCTRSCRRSRASPAGSASPGALRGPPAPHDARLTFRTCRARRRRPRRALQPLDEVNGSVSCAGLSSSPDTASPTSVQPFSSMSGRRDSSNRRAMSSTRLVLIVGRDTVCDVVERVKSPNRSRTVIVLPGRSAARMRRVTRSTTPSSTRSRSATVCGPRPMACCEPIDRRRLPVSTRRGSRLLARACRWRAAAGPISGTSSRIWSTATWPTVCSRTACSFSDVTGPTPHSRSTGSACRNRSSSSIGTTSRPSGLQSALDTLARYLVRATPTEIGRPTFSRTSVRSCCAIVDGAPRMRRSPPTSRNASSMEMPSTSGVVSRKTSKTSRLAWV